MTTPKAIIFGDNIDTDQIIAASRLVLPTIKSMSIYCFEHYPQFTNSYSAGDFIVGGQNFGCGSSREQAPAVLKERGVRAIIAKSFARIFYRNAVNLGIRLILCDAADSIGLFDKLKIEDNRLINITGNCEYPVQPFPDFIEEIINHGGIIAHLASSHREPACKE